MNNVFIHFDSACWISSPALWFGSSCISYPYHAVLFSDNTMQTCRAKWFLELFDLSAEILLLGWLNNWKKKLTSPRLLVHFTAPCKLVYCTCPCACMIIENTCIGFSYESFKLSHFSNFILLRTIFGQTTLHHTHKPKLWIDKSELLLP